MRIASGSGGICAGTTTTTINKTTAEGYQRSHTAQWTGRLCNN